MLDKSFDPATAETEIYEKWEESGAFKPKQDDAAEAYCIVIPPPNVTGSLHMGHALNNTLQDVMIRFERLRGKSVLWQPGMDHAGIATQMVVERQLAADGNQSRRELGREAFVAKIWEWKAKSGGTITNQLRRLGASCDWSRERFTLDDGLSAAVRKVFVQLHKEGLIYRAKRLVNWDPHFSTAISDLEVEAKEVQGHFWHFKYPLEGGETYEFPIEHDEDGKPTKWETRDYISIATTRPETMLGDGAVAVHPDDARYAPIVGKRVLLPLADRYIPIITDEHPDPDLGSGAVKITGAHDFNDYEVAKRHDLPMYILMDEKGCMTASDIMPAKYVGMDRFEARKHVVADIDALGLLIQIEDKVIQQPTGDRSGVAIEPMLTDQWYVDAKTLAAPALAAVKDGTTKFVPDNWSKTYFNWLEDIQPWCISRQLWWGHRIPVWYGFKVSNEDNERVIERPVAVTFRAGSGRERTSLELDPVSEVFVAETEDAAVSMAETHYRKTVFVVSNRGEALKELENNCIESGRGFPIWQDEDVLDTWFSSALWPFSTLGWPDKTPELDKFYPTNVLITGHDIIFFWVARMMMQGLHFTGQVPFPDVYIHGLVLDEHGKKMSKSKGNTIDPLGVIDKYGADALRFTMAISAAHGTNIRMSNSRVEGYRNFGTKLWNAARFCEMNECRIDPDFDAAKLSHPLNRWILHELALTAEAVTSGLEKYRFNEAASGLYKFIWNIYCDWYLELMKPVLQGDDEAAKTETRATAAYVLDQILVLLHPIMPFQTEALWGQLATRDTQLINASWPEIIPNTDATKDADEINWLIRLITSIRSVKSEMNIPPGAKLPLLVAGASAQTIERLARHQAMVAWLGRAPSVEHVAEIPNSALQLVLDEAVFGLVIEGVVDLSEERDRLNKEIDKTKGEIARIEKKLGNENFVARAPEAVVIKERAKLDEYRETLSKTQEILARLG
ncbi:MAG: valine--tRNA ligase [Robiginitomaculum sp.]|nr:MAG: valine--tRNA ligase [Robiginitomaculum sp.]